MKAGWRIGARTALVLLALSCACAEQARAENGDGATRSRPGLEALSATRERPLFSPTRRPPPPPPPPRPPPPVEEDEPGPEPELPAEADPPLSATLVGIVLGGDRPLAVLAAEGKTLRLREGESLEGWRLARIEALSAVLERDGEQVELQLRPAGGAPAAPP